MNKADKLVEATMLALQGKLELKENKKATKKPAKKSRAKKAESIDVNINDTTSVSVDKDTTIVVSVSKKYEFIFGIVGVLFIVLMFVGTMLVDSIVKDVTLKRKVKEDRRRKELERQRQEDEENHKRIKKLRF